ncbi:hypothetical protein ACFSQJ_03710 [Croceitalea marina]|uniref:Collagen-like protein n=1 Tax=Croceitalea marina TaxID=1775166 RepID=A0ABW5MS84_9FLAO
MKGHIIQIKGCILCLSLLLTLLVGCSSEDGPIGPEGPAGEQGLVGDQGPQGSEGEPGELGPERYFASEWINSELKEDFGTATSASFTIDASELSQDIMDTGLVLVFGRREDLLENQIIERLPALIDNDFEFRFQQRLGELTIIVSTVNELIDLDGNGALIEDYRYVIIPNPGNTTEKNGTTVDFTKMTYDEVVAYFNL